MNKGTLILKKSQFALGGGITFNILAISCDCDAGGAILSA